MAVLHIPNGLPNFLETVAPADDRSNLSGVHELSQGGQLRVIFAPTIASLWPTKRDNTDAFIKRARIPIIQRPPPSAAPTMM